MPSWPPRYRCLLCGRLIGLAFDPLARSEGWGDGVMRAAVATLHSALHSCLSLSSPPFFFLIQLCLLLIYIQYTIYIFIYI